MEPRFGADEAALISVFASAQVNVAPGVHPVLIWVMCTATRRVTMM